MVVVLCFLLTGTTSFEYQLATTERHVTRISRELCVPLEANATSDSTPQNEEVDATTMGMLSILDVYEDTVQASEIDNHDYELNAMNKTEEIAVTNSTASKDDMCVVVS